MVLETPAAHFEFAGPLGERLRANTEHWLLRAPTANPGMLEMFRQRDRQPVPKLTPWAGEFVGKYLMSAVQALRLNDDPRLEPFVAQVVADFIATQADDGYLGPSAARSACLATGTSGATITRCWPWCSGSSTAATVQRWTVPAGRRT